MADKNNADIEQFVLVTDREVDIDVFVDMDEDEIFKEVNAATGNKSIDAKVKKIGYTEMEFKQKVRDIVSMSSIQKYENIDTEIENKFQDFFIRYGVSEVTYYIRIKEFLQQITVEILDAVGNGQPYLLTYESMSKIRDCIITNYTDEKWEPSFSQFRRLKKVNLEDLAVIKSREYRQLKTCESLKEEDICRHLQWGEYYVNSKRGYYERGMSDKIKGMEKDFEIICNRLSF